jgi:hypothetical protein
MSVGVVKFEVFTAVTVKNAVFLDAASCGGLRLLVTANVAPSSLILVTLLV